MWKLCSKCFDKDTHQEKKPPLLHPLNCTLEELYNGVQRRIKFPRGGMVMLHERAKELYHGEVLSNADEEIILVNIPPGSKNGQKIILPRMVSVDGGKIPEDLTVLVLEEPHAVFERRGNDLWAIKKVPLVEYVSKQTLTIETLDKRILTVLKTEPGCITEILNEGWPFWHPVGMKGSLFISFEVIFPKNLSLTNEERVELKKLLSKEEDNQSINNIA